jgi:hypothetical protein
MLCVVCGVFLRQREDLYPGVGWVASFPTPVPQYTTVVSLDGDWLNIAYGTDVPNLRERLRQALANESRRSR